MDEELFDIIYAYVIDEQRFSSGETIFREGEEGGWMFVVLEGKVAVKKASPKGQVKVYVLGEGEILGESSFLSSGASRRSATAVAEGEVLLGVMDPDRMKYEISSLPQRIKAIFAGLSQRLRRTTKDAAAMVKG